MIKNYLLCYDIADKKRLYHVKKYAYTLALGGQKSALEVPMSHLSAKTVLSQITKLMKLDEDRVNIIEVEQNPIILGKAIYIEYDEGVIII